MILYSHRFETPFGWMLAAVDEASALVQLDFLKGEERFSDRLPAQGLTFVPDAKRCELVGQQLEQYFARQRQVFDLPLAYHGTEFQRRVWQEWGRKHVWRSVWRRGR